MGFYIFSQCIETDKIKNVFGSNDENILKLIKKSETFEDYKDFSFEGFKTTTEKALDDIIYNKPYDVKSNFAYGYAIICISGALGKELPYTQEIKLGYETNLIDQYLDEDFGIVNFIDDTLFEEIPLFDIPLIDDWPLIGICNQKKLKELNDILKDVKIICEEIESFEEENDDKICAYMHIKGLNENIEYCIKNNLDMINFCH